MSDLWSKALRGGGPPSASTPRAKSYSNRYGGRGNPEDDMLDSADSAQRRTPRQAGMYDRPWKESPLSAMSGRSTPRGAGRAYARPPMPRQNSGTNDEADAASVAESDDLSVATEDDVREGMLDGESVQVFVRVRPINGTEASEADQYNCTRIYGDRTLWVELRHRPEPYQFKFDCVLPEQTSQLEIFERAGKPIVDNCMGGYNSTIFAYGQTGAGKTYTMQGPLTAALEGQDERGLAPRVFEYLFAEIDKAQDEKCHENLTFCCRCSMLEIYNEVITDLLNPSATNLQIREDIKRGCYVEDLSEQLIQNMSDAMRLMRTGAENRHVGETRLNRESSRSHSVFTCTLERHSKSEETGVTNVLFSRLNLIDLAGSERIHGGEHGGSQATGRHFKEACHINKSLTTLGRVIMELVEAQRSSGGGGGRPGAGPSAASKARHVPYRDSRLTFLLQDSLGGNAKTLMIANVSPSSVSAQETLSTLQFMSRAKCIRNRATINLDARGDVVLLQREIVRLNTELDNLRKGYTEPAVQENKDLRAKLDEMCSAKGQMEARLLGLEKENLNLKAERRRLDHKMMQIQKGAGQLDQAIFSLTAKVMYHESLAAAAAEKTLLATQAEHELQVLELRRALSQHAEGNGELQGLVESLREELQQERSGRRDAELRLQDELRQAVAVAADKVAGMQRELAAVHGTVQQLQGENERLREQVAQAHEQHEERARLAEAAAASKALRAQLDEARDARDEAREALEAARGVNAGLDEQVKSLMQELGQAEAKLAAKDKQLAASASELEEVRRALDASRAEAGEAASTGEQERRQLQQQLDEERAAAAERGAQVEALEASLSELNSSFKERSSALDGAQEQCRQLQADLDASSAAAAARAEQLEHDLAAARESSKSRQEELMKQVTEVHLQLSAAQQEAEHLQDELDTARGDTGVLQAQLADAQGQIEGLRSQASSKGLDCDLLRKKLAAAESAASSLRGELDERQGDVDGLRQQLKKVEAAAQAAQEKANGKLNALQRELMDSQELLTSRGFEVQQLQRRLEEMGQRVADKNTSLDAHRDEVKSLKSTLAKVEGTARQRDALLADKSALADQLQADNEALHARVHRLQEELAVRENQLRSKLNVHELQLKEQIVYNARNRQAMNEIRKVINWAQQAPSTPLTASIDRGGGRLAAGRQSVGSVGLGRHHRRSGAPAAVMAFNSPGEACELPLPEEECSFEDGAGCCSSGNDSSPGSRSAGSSGGSQLAPGLPGPDGGEPLQLEQTASAASSSGGSGRAGGGNTNSAAAVVAAVGRSGSAGGGDALVSLSIGARAGGSAKLGGRGRCQAGQSRAARGAGEVCGSADVDAQEDVHGTGEGQFYSDGSQGGDASEGSRRLLGPEQASSPLHLSCEDSLSHLAAAGRAAQLAAARGSRRGGDRAAQHRDVRAGSDSHSFAASHKQPPPALLASADGSVVLSVSGEWSAAHSSGGGGGATGSGGQQPDMRLPSHIVGSYELMRDA